MRIWKITIILFFLGNCSQIYSPFGIRGGNALAEIESSRTVASLVTLPLQQRATQIDFSQVEPPICTIQDTAISSSTNGSSPASFSLPNSSKLLDLKAEGSGTHFFRSETIPNADFLDTVKIQTIRTNTNPNVTQNSCRFQLSFNCSTAMSLSEQGYFAISASEPTDIGNKDQYQSGMCLKVLCVEPAVVRLRNDPKANQPESVRTQLDAANLVLGRDIFNSLAKIQKDRYYTRDSFKSCKDAVVLISLLQAVQNARDIDAYTDARIQNRFCNQLIPSLTTQKNNTLGNLVQGGACNMQEVNWIGF